MKRINLNKKVESKNDIRCYYTISNNMISILDTLTHDYLLHLDLEEDGEEVVKTALKSILSMDDLTYYTLVLDTGVDKETLKDRAQAYISGLKDTKHTTSIEWLNKAWFDSTMSFIDKHNLGEMMPINGIKALEAVIAYQEPKKSRGANEVKKEILEESLETKKPEESIKVTNITEGSKKPKRKFKFKSRK